MTTKIRQARSGRKPGIEAEPAYENGHMIARDQLQRIGELLGDLPTPDADGRPVNWGHVGSMTEVNRQLSEVISFMESIT